MAIKSTIFKANVQIADIDHGYYADHALTLARHPSETDERMMIRLCALAWQAHQLQDICQGDGQLAFGAGLSDPSEPDVWLRDFTGRTRLWVEVGQPEDKPLHKACAKADLVVTYAYGAAAGIGREGCDLPGKTRHLPTREALRKILRQAREAAVARGLATTARPFWAVSDES